MNTQGEAILSLCRGMRKLNAEIAALIKTADKILSKKRFRTDGGNTVIKDTSASLDLPEKWTPMKMYRVYHSMHDHDEIIVLNVCLESLSKPEALEQPLLVCAKFQYEKGQAGDCAGEWDAWDMWRHRAVDQIAVGQVYSKEDVQRQPEQFKRFLAESEWTLQEVNAMQRIKFIAVPLTDIQDSKALDREVFQRIM